MLRKNIGEEKPSRNIRCKKSDQKFSFVTNPSTKHVLEIGKMRFSENISHIKNHPKPQRRKKLPMLKTPFARLKVSTNTLRWMFVIVFVYLIIGIVVFLLMQQGSQSIRDVVVYSIMGFVTFFMGYFGWRVAQVLRETIVSKRPKDDF